MSKLVARKLRVERGGNTILANVDFRAEAGEYIGILGPSGSGKSTLLMALSGFRPADEGTVRLGSVNVYEDFDAVKADIGFVPQDDIVPHALKVERVLGYAAELRLADQPAEVRQGRVDGVIHALGLSERRNLRVSKLSGGQRKRVSIGVELLVRPSILFADEPGSGLDPGLERSLSETFRKLADDGNIVVVTTHVMGSLDLFDALCVVVAGSLAYFGPPGELKAYFGVDDFTQVYAALASRPAKDWSDKFKASKYRSRLG